MDKGKLSTETPSSYIPWNNNTQVEKNDTTELRIETGTSLTVDNDVTTDPTSLTNSLTIHQTIIVI